MTVFSKVFEKGFMTVADFEVFLKSRGERERWQLIGGQPIMMNPPTLAHQRIAANFQMHMNAALAKARPELFAYATVGVRNGDAPSYAPEPAVAVIPSKATFEHYTREFHVVLEVKSDSNTIDLIRRKLDFYKASASILYILVAEQRAPDIDIYARKNGFQPAKRVELADTVELPEFGFEATLAEIYQATPAAEL